MDERACNVCGALHRESRDQRLLACDVAEGMILNSSKDNGEQNCDAHRDGTEHTEAAHLTERPRQADEKAGDCNDDAPDNRARSGAIGEGVK